VNDFAGLSIGLFLFQAIDQIYMGFIPFKAVECTVNGKTGDSQLIIERAHLPVDPFCFDQLL